MIDLRTVWQQLRPRQTIGCDCGAAAVKMVHLEQRGEQSYLLRSAAQTLEGPEDVAAEAALRAVVHELGIRRPRVALNVGDRHVLMERMEFAKMPERDLQLAIRWHFRKEIEGALERLRVTYSTVAAVDGGKRRLLIGYGVDRRYLEQRTALAKRVGIHLATLEPNATALLAAFAHSRGFVPNQTTAVIDVGDQSSMFLIFANATIRFVRRMPDLYLDQLATRLQPTPDDAIPQRRKALHNVLMHREGIAEETWQMLRDFYSTWLVEVQRSIDTYLALGSEQQPLTVDNLVLTGGGALLPDIAEIAHKNLGIPCETLDPFLHMITPDGGRVTLRDGPLYACAVGLALPQG
ncbi:MAG: pilus assembly protein PilM [Deltaproteobacteria bacterium]|nr:pilus assembly protein PilM [Deltaproteobacteria bacterium]